ncbi:trans-1,2-dihydrobenzene-1,2-diol dehydrogenase-like [Festucalex cinctus]
MNSGQVKDLVDAARTNKVFLMEIRWSFVYPITLIPITIRVLNRFDNIGVYCLQFVLMAFDGERPVSGHAMGALLDSGVDASVVVVLKFSRKRMATCAFSIISRRAPVCLSLTEIMDEIRKQVGVVFSQDSH